jgi:hypothetical protein
MAKDATLAGRGQGELIPRGHGEFEIHTWVIKDIQMGNKIDLAQRDSEREPLRRCGEMIHLRACPETRTVSKCRRGPCHTFETCTPYLYYSSKISLNLIISRL